MIIELVGDLTPVLIFQLDEALAKGEHVELLINSPGGDTALAEQVHQAIWRLSNQYLNVNGTVIGEAMSAAFMILQACRIRRAVASATLMFHPPQITLPGGYSMGGERAMDPDDPYYQGFLEKLSLRSDIPVSKLDYWGLQERVFTAEEALQNDFIDEVF